MYFPWKRLEKKVSEWKTLYNNVYNSLGKNEYRFETPLHVKVRVEPHKYREFKVDTIKTDETLAGKCIKFKLGGYEPINVYPQFELKSDSKIVREDVIFEIIKDRLIDDGLYDEKTTIKTVTVIV